MSVALLSCDRITRDSYYVKHYVGQAYHALQKCSFSLEETRILHIIGLVYLPDQHAIRSFDRPQRQLFKNRGAPPGTCMYVKAKIWRRMYSTTAKDKIRSYQVIALEVSSRSL